MLAAVRPLAHLRPAPTGTSERGGRARFGSSAALSRGFAVQALAPGGGASSPPPPPTEGIRVVRVEGQGVAVEGVARVDRGEGDSSSRMAVLAAGDLFVLLAFTAYGRATHGEPVLTLDTIGTGLPFVVGWFAAGVVVDGYGRAARGADGIPAAALSALKTWGLGIPLGLVLRSLSRGYLPPPSFVIVSLAVTLAVMVGWRSAHAATVPKGSEDAEARDRQLKDRSGNPLEFLAFLSSLVKRW